MRYYIQRQSPDQQGWTDHLGTNNLDEANTHMNFCIKNWDTETFRLIERQDKVIRFYSSQGRLEI